MMTITKWNLSRMQGWLDMHKSINIMYRISRMKDAKDRIIPIDAETAFDEAQHQFVIKKTAF